MAFKNMKTIAGAFAIAVSGGAAASAQVGFEVGPELYDAVKPCIQKDASAQEACIRENTQQFTDAQLAAAQAQKAFIPEAQWNTAICIVEKLADHLVAHADTVVGVYEDAEEFLIDKDKFDDLKGLARDEINMAATCHAQFMPEVPFPVSADEIIQQLETRRGQLLQLQP